MVSRDSLTGDGASADRYADSGSSLRGLPGDLVLLVVYSLLVGVGIFLGIPATPRFVLGLPLVVFAPGYALLAALFPGRPSRNAGGVSSLSGMSRQFASIRSIQRRGVRWGERVALSFGLSLFLIPPFGIGLGLARIFLATGSLFHTVPIVVVLVGFVVLASLVGVVRRLRLARAERFGVPVGYWLDDFTDGLTGSPVDALLNVLLVLAVLVGAATMTYALAVPQDAETSTFLRVGTLDDAGNFEVDPATNLTEGEAQQYTLTVENNEQRAVNYTVVAQLQRLDGDEVAARDELTRFSSPTIPANRTWQNQHTVTPDVAGENLRLAYLLYLGEAPQNPTEATANESLSLSVDVANATSGGG